jgi:hypothetical protein
MKYQQSKLPRGINFASRFNNGQGLNQGANRQGNRMGFRPVNGEIIAVDDKSITIKMNDGSSRIVFLTDQTQINKADQGTKTDLQVGTTVVAFGQDNNDGTLTAQNIQLNPQQHGLPGSNQPTLVE